MSTEIFRRARKVIVTRRPPGLGIDSVELYGKGEHDDLLINIAAVQLACEPVGTEVFVFALVGDSQYWLVCAYVETVRFGVQYHRMIDGPRPLQGPEQIDNEVLQILDNNGENL